MGTYYPERSVFGYTTSKIKADLLGCGGKFNTETTGFQP